MTKNTFFIFLFVLFFVPSSAYARNFLRPLRVGDYGEDVRFVQQVLNLSPETQVAASGPGSRGKETALFGPATRVAVMKLQALYSSEVLTPAGVSSPTGVAGNYTLAKINRLWETSIKAQKNTTSSTTQSSTGAPFILSVTPAVFSNGQSVRITGKNFSQNNTILFSLENDNKFTGIFSPNGTEIAFSPSVSIANYLQSGMNALSGSARTEAIKLLISKGKLVSGPEDGAGYVSARISVKNDNGTSNSVSVLVKVLQ